MNTKIIELGTQHNVKVLSATKNLIALHGDDGEGYLLAYRGIKELPKEGDSGTITFIKNENPKDTLQDTRLRVNNGYWHYEPLNHLQP